MRETELFTCLLRQTGLGELTAEPSRVSGGYMHRMYRLETAAGAYAAKLMNPEIMKRPGVFENYRRAEMLEGVLEKNRIPVVGALELNGRKMQEIAGQYIYIFPWIDGRAISWAEITENHCRAVGEILGRIHGILRSDGKNDVAKIDVDWNGLISGAEGVCPNLANALRERLALLVRAQDDYNAAVAALPDITTITNGDMDCKNVLWSEGRPFVIDLECLNYGNPMMDMFILALSWAGGDACRMNYAHLRAFISSYARVYGPLDADPEKLYGLGFSWLEWLEYNAKRALGIECADAEEQRLGLDEALNTLNRIVYYDSLRGALPANINKWISEVNTHEHP
jgi:Ser/Thr protein kinase RdoA (MazF antagonist)